MRLRACCLGRWEMRLPRKTNRSARMLNLRAALVTSHQSRVTPFLIFLITRGLRSTADGPSPKCSSAETTRKLLSGGARPRSKKPGAIARTCCRGNKMELLEVLIHPMRSHSRAAGQPLPLKDAPKVGAGCEDS